MDLSESAEHFLTEMEKRMNEIVVNGPWIVAQLVRVRTLEAEVRTLLATGQPSRSVLRGRVLELNRQLTLLDLAIG
jgi:hypothetical protein